MSHIFSKEKDLLKNLVAQGILELNPDGTYK